MVLRWAARALAAMGAVSTVVLAKSVNEFTTGPNNASLGGGDGTLAWLIGEEVTVNWNTNFKNVQVGFSAADDLSTWTQVYEGPGDSSMDWVVDVNGTDWTPTSNNYFFLICSDASNGDNFFYSDAVIIISLTNNADMSTTTSFSTVSQAAITAPPTPTATMTAVVTLTVGPASTKATATPTPSSKADAQADSKGANPSVTASPGLSSGAIAGIAIAAVAGVAALAAAAFFLRRNRNLRKQLRNSIANTHAPYVPYDQLPPNTGAASGMDMGKDAAAFGAAAAGGAIAGGAAGYYGNEKNHPGFAATPATRHDSVMEMAADPIPYRDSHIPEAPVEIGGTELTGPPDIEEEDIAADSRPLMGQHPRDTT